MEKKVKRRPKRGQPTKFTPENCKRVLHAIRLGSAIRIAVKCGGWSHETYYKFIRQGEEDGKGPYYDFACEVERAKGERANTWLERIEEASKEQWQAAAWKLERLYPNEYGRVIRAEHTGAQGGPIETKGEVKAEVSIQQELQKPERMGPVLELAKRYGIMDHILEPVVTNDGTASEEEGNGSAKSSDRNTASP